MQQIKCPLCDWEMDATPPEVPYNALGEVFGLGVMAQVAYNEHVHKVERELRQHLSSHKLEEWVRKVTELTALLDVVTAEAAKARRA
jgi:hypothetical protein